METRSGQRWTARNLTPAFTIFNRYHEKLESRLENTLATLPQTLEGFDYELDEYLVIDHSTMPWAPNAEELDERWRKRLKNQALSLLLADKPAEGDSRYVKAPLSKPAKSARSIQRAGRIPDLCQYACRAIRSAHQLLLSAPRRELRHQHESLVRGHRRDAANR